jgi:ATP-dependent protease ClpP protease subunit
MPNWSEIYNEVRRSGHTTDSVRRKHLKKLAKLTGRNVITYYSGWLQKKKSLVGTALEFEISDRDKNGFMSVINNMDRSKGLDLLLHTPGGDIAAVESLIDFLRQMFGVNIRAIIPQMAMSAGSLIACACKEIVMGPQSNIGPFDPQYMGVPAQAILTEFKRAAHDIVANQATAYIWQPAMGPFSLGKISVVENIVSMADELAKRVLVECMFVNDPSPSELAENVVRELGSHAATALHSRHIHRAKAKAIGLKIVDLDEDKRLQDAVLSVHHATMITFDQARAIKIIENHEGSAYILTPDMLIDL